jgi:hypothetical protein
MGFCLRNQKIKTPVQIFNLLSNEPEVIKLCYASNHPPHDLHTQRTYTQRPYVLPTRPSTTPEWMSYHTEKLSAIDNLSDWIARAKAIPQAQPSDPGFLPEIWAFSFTEIHVNEYLLIPNLPGTQSPQPLSILALRTIWHR